MPLQVNKPRRRLQFTLRTLLVGTAVFAAILGTTLWIAGRARDSDETAHCRARLRAIHFAFLHAEEDCSCFLSAHTEDAHGRRMHSWRVLLLEYDCGYSHLHREYCPDEPWDSPHNRQLETECSAYHCPADGSATENHATSYLAVTGPGTAWPVATSCRLAHTASGDSHTALLVEMANSGIHWMEPRDLEFDELDPTVNGQPKKSISSIHLGGANVLFRDGSVRCVPRNTSPEIVEAMLRSNGSP
jgi:prepilin-type processing-associated H-X9-DG protein